MNLNLNKLAASALFPISKQVTTNLMLLADDKGSIIHIWDDQITNVFLNDLIRPLRKEVNLFRCFNMDPYVSLSGIPRDSVKSFPGRPDFFKVSDSNGFTTSLPVCRIRINPVEGNRYLCMVYVPEFLPNIIYRDAGCLLYLDRNDNLVGFNRSFFQFFRHGFKAPGELLGLHASAFFTPTPTQIQGAYFSANPLEETGRHAAVLALDNRPLKSNDVLALDHEFSLAGTDFLLEMTFVLQHGSLPLVSIGNRQEEGGVNDDEGYTLGANAPEHSFFLKKFGLYVLENPGKGLPATGDLHYRFQKSGKAFYMACNGREVIRYFDFEMTGDSRKVLFISLRPESAVLVKNLCLKTYEAAQPYRQEDVLVRLKTPGENHFTINRFYNRVLSSNHEGICGYILRNVTALKRDAVHFQSLYQDEKSQGDRLKSLFSSIMGDDSAFLGDSTESEAIRKKAEIVANTDTTVLIQGETGTGKEVLAKYIHAKSARADGPFVKVDCSTLAPTLLESELFGHEKGAFTGAFQEKKGKFELADEGTLFLDEVSNLDPVVQAKILGFLQDFTITRVGGRKAISLNLRIIVAANIRLEEMVEKGLFRKDLLFRMNVVTIDLPRLAERPDDIPQLCDCFIRAFALQYGKKAAGLTSAAYQKLYGHSWPGNVRELKHVLQRAVIFSDNEWIDADQIQFSPSPGSTDNAGPGRRPLKEVGREKLVEAVKRAGGSVTRTARAFGITRQSLYYNLRKHGIDVKLYRKK